MSGRSSRQKYTRKSTALALSESLTFPAGSAKHGITFVQERPSEMSTRMQKFLDTDGVTVTILVRALKTASCGAWMTSSRKI